MMRFVWGMVIAAICISVLGPIGGAIAIVGYMIVEVIARSSDQRVQFENAKDRLAIEEREEREEREVHDLEVELDLDEERVQDLLTDEQWRAYGQGVCSIAASGMSRRGEVMARRRLLERYAALRVSQLKAARDRRPDIPIDLTDEAEPLRD